MGEKFAANPVTGTASLSVPISLSPGRSGFGPQLSLAYDSGAGNGPFGFGWNLSLSAITRKTEKGLPRYQDAAESDVFLLSDAEDLVPALAEVDGRWERIVATRRSGAEEYDVHRYRPRIEGLFARIERWTRRRDGDTHWRVTSGDNVTTLYGKTAASRVFDPNDAAHVFRWLICESHDDKGNAIVYEYQAEDEAGVDLSQQHEKNRSRSAGRYLKRIRYGNRVSRLIEPDLTRADWLFEAVFDYGQDHYLDLPLDPERPEAEQHRRVLAAASPGRSWPVRPDPFSTYRAGFEVRTYRRCHRVLMFHRFDELGDEPCLVSATELEYQDLDPNRGPDPEDTPPMPVETELAHQGSTRFGSFIRTVTRSGYVRDAGRAALDRDGVTYVTYVKKSLPPLELEYSKAAIQDDLREPDTESLGNAPVGLDGATYQWVDLDGDGLSGILTEQPGGWYYKRNLSPLGTGAPASGAPASGQPNGSPHLEARFAPLERVAALPSLAAGPGRRRRFLDLAGDGRLDLVELGGAMPGFYERTDDGRWAPFLPFASLPVVDWSDPNLRFVDLTGDGHADVLMTEDDVLRWYPSLAEDGFGAAERVPRAQDEGQGPRLVFADATQSVFLADMCGDGLVDVVRVRNGEVCYWPNLGYGRFGARVGMDNAPWLDSPDRFDPRRLRLADVDGTGPNDLVYLGGDGVRLYFNQSGNRWSEPRRLSQFPPVDDLSSVETVDLLGNGTVCLVWSSPSAADSRRPLRYVDLVGAQKPQLLIKSVNNLGAETHVHYAPSTKFSLADRLAGRPWITRLPFPVHVVERVETYDRISGNRFVTRYAYHHGYFDGDDREFRGFALVDQDDTEELAALGAGRHFPAGTNEAGASHVPPVRTRTWFHTGAYAGRSHTADAFAGLLDGRDAGEYYREPGLSDARARALLLDDTVLPEGLSVEDERDACRALKGSLLRQEIYALDGTDREQHPYAVTEQSFSVEPVQPRSGERPGVYFSHPREALRIDYERDPTDPRVGHAFTLEVDRFGNVLRSAAVGYGRRAPDASLPAADQAEQTRRFVTCSEHSFTNAIEREDDYRAPLPSETRTYELTGLRLEGGATRFGFAALAGALDAAALIPYHQPADAALLQKRLVERRRVRYRPDDLGASAGEATALLPVGVLEPLALPGESYRLAFTPDLIEHLFGGRVTPDVLSSEGGYVDAAGDGDWWLPAGRRFLSAEAGDPPAQELATARAHFFVPRRFRDPFGHEATTTADVYDLLAVGTRDPLGNTVTAVNDYRTLRPRLVTDPNGNRSEVAFDALGQVVGSALMGKPAEGRGDTLTGFTPDLVEAEVQAHLADPLSDPHAILQGATSRQVYDPFAYARTRSEAGPQGAVVYSLTRETHQSDLAAGETSRVRHAFTYSDGFGREIQQKLPAEPGPLAAGGADAGPRWVGSGWTVFDNKGQPVRQFEPFFSATHRFEFDVRRGVSPILCYDPLERVVVTLHPNHTWQKVVFDPWRQATWDVSDTALIASPAADADAGGYFARLPVDDYLPTWYAQRSGGDLGAHELAAATKTAAHAETPTITHTDSLGRAFLTVAHCALKRSDSPAEAPPESRFQRTRIVLDVEGNQRAVVDAMERVVVRYDYDLLGNRVYAAGMDFGERWSLNDVTGKPIRSWDSRGHAIRTEYDALRRPLCARVSGGDAARSDPRVLGREVMFTRIEYGEGQPDDVALNLRTRICRLHDGAGTVASEAYDFKGNLLRGSRRLARDYKGLPDWAGEVPLEDGSFASGTTYDALNRPVTVTSPDGSVVRPRYNAAGLLERVDANLRGEMQDGEAVWTPFVGDVAYNARGQRERVALGNGASTRYVYDPLSLRLTRLFTARSTTAFPDDCPSAPPAGWPGCAVQNLSYTYDPVGNISRIQDDAQQLVFFRNVRVEPSNDFLYDSTNRLVEATGREHLGQVDGPAAAPDAPNGFHTGHPHPGDGQAMGPYRERYAYDPAGNFRQLTHEAGAGGWTRDYAYAETSLLESGAVGNRLTSTRVGSRPDERYAHDAHGNMSRLPHLPLMRWSFLDQLQASSQQAVSSGTPETTYYVYDAAGQRVRKVTERRAAAGDAAARKDERLYLGGFEVFRAYAGDGVTTTLERETLHVMDGSQRVALVETRTHGEDGSAARLTRYQLGNHLGSASLELDEAARIISYEEFYPYGSASYQAVDASIRAAAKRYRYTAMERDEETGLAYHGARYYAAWLGRWTSADPLGVRDALDVYEYVSGNPVRLKDSTGLEDEEDALSELASDVLHGVKANPIDTSSVGHYDLELSVIPFENALKRNSNPSKVPFPEEFGMHVNGDPDYPAWRHALEDVPGNPDSPWISATRNLEASSFRGTEYLIDADQLTEFLDHPQVVQEVKDAIARGELNAERGQKWLDSQVKGAVEMEALIKNDVPAEAIRRMDQLKKVVVSAEQIDVSTGVQLLKTYGPRFARGANAVGAVMTFVDVASATKASYDLGSPKPLAAEAVRQVFAWGGGIGGTFVGAVGGAAAGGGGTASFTWETGPLGIGLTVAGGGTGAVVGGVAGNVGGSFAGYSLGDWLADTYIHPN